LAAAAPAGNGSSQLIGAADDLDLLALAAVQRAVLPAHGVLARRGGPDLPFALDHRDGIRADLGTQQHLAAARGLQHKGGISRARPDPEGSADCRVETSVDVGNLCAAAVLRSAAVHPQARADLDSTVRLVPD